MIFRPLQFFFKTIESRLPMRWLHDNSAINIPMISLPNNLWNNLTTAFLELILWMLIKNSLDETPQCYGRDLPRTLYKKSGGRRNTK